MAANPQSDMGPGSDPVLLQRLSLLASHLVVALVANWNCRRRTRLRTSCPHRHLVLLELLLLRRLPLHLL